MPQIFVFALWPELGELVGISAAMCSRSSGPGSAGPANRALATRRQRIRPRSQGAARFYLGQRTREPTPGNNNFILDRIAIHGELSRGQAHLNSSFCLHLIPLLERRFAGQRAKQSSSQ